MTAQHDPHRPAQPADRPYPPEPWDLTGTGAITTWRVPVGSLPGLPSGVRAAEVRGTALVTTAFVRYDHRGLMAYDELLAAVVVRHGRGLALSITDIWVDSETSVAGGRGLWGIPKDLATFGEHYAETADGPIASASFSSRRAPALRLRRADARRPDRGQPDPRRRHRAPGDRPVGPRRRRPAGVAARRTPSDEPAGPRLLDALRQLRGRPRGRAGHYPPSVTSLTRRVLGPAVQALWAWLDSVGEIVPGTRTADRFGAFGEGSAIGFPTATVMNPSSIHIGRDTLIGRQVTLSVGYGVGDPGMPERGLVIGDKCIIGARCTLTAHESIVVGDGVWFGQDVFVSDAGHGYQDPDVPIGDQFGSHDPVVIGPGSWIGHGAILLQGTRLGRNVVVAAGSVVRGEVPDHAVVAGTPARVVRRYEPGIGWVGRTGDIRPVVRADYLQDALTELRERA